MRFDQMFSVWISQNAKFFSRMSSLGNYTALLMMLFVYPATGQTVNMGAPRAWLAQWITSVDVPPKGKCMLRLRKAITLKAAPENFIVHVSADNQFVLMVNGKLVGTGPAHSDLQH